MSGGTEIVSSGGIAQSSVVGSGNEDVFAGGVASGTTVNGNGGWQYVFAGGTASATGVSNNGAQLVFLGGVASGTAGLVGRLPARLRRCCRRHRVSAGAQDYIESGGFGSATTVLGGGVEQVLAGGMASVTFLANGTYQLDFGSAINTEIAAGAQQYVESGGHGAVAASYSAAASSRFWLAAWTSGEKVFSAAYQLDFGAVSGVSISGGAYQYVYGGATATNTSVGSGGLEEIVARRHCHRHRP